MALKALKNKIFFFKEPKHFACILVRSEFT